MSQEDKTGLEIIQDKTKIYVDRIITDEKEREFIKNLTPEQIVWISCYHTFLCASIASMFIVMMKGVITCPDFMKDPELPLIGVGFPILKDNPNEIKH